MTMNEWVKGRVGVAKNGMGVAMHLPTVCPSRMGRGRGNEWVQGHVSGQNNEWV